MTSSIPRGSGLGDFIGRADVNRVAVVLISAIALGGIARALTLAWICDDAFISLRYAANLVAGDGLVYNVGEYVEGYTNLLWTLLIAAFVALEKTIPAGYWVGRVTGAALVAWGGTMIAIAVTLPRPGRTPKMMPSTMPQQMKKRLVRVKAASKPAIRLSIIPAAPGS